MSPRGEAARRRTKNHGQQQGKNTRPTRARHKVDNPSWVVVDGYEEEWYEDKDVEATIAYLDMLLGITSDAQNNKKGREAKNNNRGDKR